MAYLYTEVWASEAPDNLQTVNSYRNNPRIAAVQALQVSFAAVYCGNDSPELACKPDHIISMEYCFHGALG
ncbi:MAG: hypothetical protein WAM53_01665 [Terrimicrobiaceae bacterium]